METAEGAGEAKPKRVQRESRVIPARRDRWPPFISQGKNAVTNAKSHRDALRAARTLYIEAAGCADPCFWLLLAEEMAFAIALIEAWEEPAALDRMRSGGLGWIAEALATGNYYELGDFSSTKRG